MIQHQPIGHLAAKHCATRMQAIAAVRRFATGLDPERRRGWRFEAGVPIEVKGQPGASVMAVIAQRGFDHVVAFYGDPMWSDGPNGGETVVPFDAGRRLRPRALAGGAVA